MTDALCHVRMTNAWIKLVSHSVIPCIIKSFTVCIDTLGEDMDQYKTVILTSNPRLLPHINTFTIPYSPPQTHIC